MHDPVELTGLSRHDGDTDSGSLPLVVMAHLGERHRKLRRHEVPQRSDDMTFLLERVNVAKTQLDPHGGSMHHRTPQVRATSRTS